MKALTKLTAQFVLLVWWLSGIAIANGFWSTTLAIFVPPYGLYLTVERLVKLLPA